LELFVMPSERITQIVPFVERMSAFHPMRHSVVNISPLHAGAGRFSAQEIVEADDRGRGPAHKPLSLTKEAARRALARGGPYVNSRLEYDAAFAEIAHVIDAD
jgi:hypothetical protein